MLVTLDDMKNYLGIPLLDTTQDTFLTFQISLVSEAIEGYCNRVFSEATYTQTFYARDYYNYPLSINLFHYPFKTLNTIVEKTLPSDTGIAVEDYVIHKPTSILTKLFDRFFRNGTILEVEYVAGYTNLPMAIQNVIYGVVQERYNKKVNGVDLNFGTDVQRISIPGTISIDFDYSLNNNERKTHFGQILGSYVNTLDSYRSERAVMGDIRLAYVQ